MTCRHNIEHLPPEVISKLRSCVSINSVSQCVEELVLNSVDACAKNVAVRLDLTYFKIQVVDNGFGIPKDELEVIGERYHTSKCHGIDDLKNLRFNGFRGEAIASLRDICAVLEITSRTQDNRTYFKAFHYGMSTEVRLSVDERPSVGTTVTILDFMYNLPVRRKGICTFRDFEFTRHSLECIALVNPNISFTLRNNQTGETCLNTRRTTSMTSCFRYLFECDKVLKEISHQGIGLKVQGFVSTDGHTTSDLQFVYVNCRLILRTRIHELVRSILMKYLNSKNREFTSPSVPTSPRKLLAHPVFALNILCPFYAYDICFEPRKSLIEFEDWEKVTNTIKDLLRTFLQNEGYSFESEEKYLKTNSEECQNESADKTIDTFNSRNALFSRVIKRSKARKVKGKNKTQNMEVKLDSSGKQCSSGLPVENQTCGTKNCLNVQIPYSTSSDKLYSEVKTKIQVNCVPLDHHSQDNFPTSFENSFKVRTSYQESFDSSTELRTSNYVPLPVALRFNSRPSPLSLLRSRKRKEASLKELKDSFQYQKLLKQGNCEAYTKCSNLGQDLSNESIKKYSSSRGLRQTKNSSKVDGNKQCADPIDFSDLEPHPETDLTCSYTENRCEMPNTHKATDDKWSILSQSQEIINQTEPFMVTQPFSVPQRIEPEANVRNKHASEDQDFLSFLDSTPASSSNTELTKLSNRTILHNSPSTSFSPQKCDSYSSVTPAGQSQPTNLSTNPLVPCFPTMSSVSDHSSAIQTHSNVQLASNSVPSCSNSGVNVSHSVSSPFTACSFLLKSNKEGWEQQDWIQWQDLDSGNILYINKVTGNSSYVPPPQTPTFQLHKKDIVDGHFFLSHNSTPFLPRLDRNLFNCEDATLANKDLLDMLDVWQNPVFKRSNFKEINNTACHMRKPLVRVYNIVQNYKFFKSMFSKAVILGQVDCKFIACLVPSNPDEDSGPNLLVLFDQHAVHERIRLEQFTKELYRSEGQVEVSTLQPPLRLEVAPEYARLARAYSSQLEKTAGLGIELERSPCSVAISLRCIPTCLSEREASELRNNRPSILATLTKSLLEEQVEKIKGTSSLGGAIPKTLHTVLSSKACKGAIKFGDPLKEEDCSQLVRHLSSCQLPFQCAHGRPSVIPVLDMAHLTRPLHWKIQRPRLFRLSKCKVDM